MSEVRVGVRDKSGNSLNDPQFDGYISSICVAGKIYKLRC